MKTVLSVLLLLAALTGANPALFSRRYIHVKQYVTWAEAQTYCRMNYVDLATFSDQEDLDRFQLDVETPEYLWIGLNMDQNTSKNIYWSDGSLLDDANLITGYGCAFVQYFFWSTVACEHRLNFICYTWEPELIMVQKAKPWEEALKYCRTYFTDLVSIYMEKDYLAVKSKISVSQASSFWSSLRFLDGSWFWVNLKLTFNQSLSFLPSCPASPFRCGSLHTAENDFLDISNCEEKMNFFCYKGNQT